MSTIYVIHKNGELFSTRGKVGYLTEVAANGVVTVLSEHEAIESFSKETSMGWYSISKDEQKARIEAARASYEVVAYGPTGGDGE